MFRTFANAWKIAELRSKLLYTAVIILIYRIGSAIAVPFVNIEDGIWNGAENTFMTYLSMMTGDAFNMGTLFALSITPYINASIIIQLLTVAIPALQKLSKEGEEGRKKMNKITRYSALALGFLQSIAYYFFIESRGLLLRDSHGMEFTGAYAVLQAVVVILCYTAGTAIVMWLGERINEKGIGNGTSMILFAGIVARMPTTLYGLWESFSRGGAKGQYYVLVPIATVALVGMIFFIVWMDNAERRIPVQYAKRVVGRKMYGGQNTHMPIKVNMCGVMPVIFASSILSILPTVAMFIDLDPSNWFYKLCYEWLGQTHPFYGTIYFLFMIFFAYFYAAIQYNPIEMADNLRRNSGSIPGIRPGKPTSLYIQKILNRVTLIGALLLSVIAMFPILYSQLSGLLGAEMNLMIGGTSIIIMVGVALETEKQLESQMMMRHYKGFLD